MSEEQRWIYKSRWDFTLVLKPTTKKGLSDGMGGFAQVITIPPVKIVFNGCTFVLNESVATRLGYPLKTIAEWIAVHHKFGKTFWLAQSPDFVLSKEDLDKLEKERQASRKAGPKVASGPRATGSLS